MILVLLFAGAHSSSNASAWTGACLLNNARWWSAAVEEQKQIISKYKGQTGYSSLLEMDVLHRCIKEALRMHPPAPMLIRKAHKQFVVQTKQGNEYEIPAEGSLCLMSSTTILPIFCTSVIYDHHIWCRASDRYQQCMPWIRASAEIDFSKLAEERLLCKCRHVLL